MERAGLDSIRGFLVYVSKTYRDMNPYLKGTNMALESLRPHRDGEGWRFRGEALMIVDLEGKWYGVEYIYIHKPRLVKGVSRMGDELVALGRLTEMINPTRRQLRAGR